MHVLPLYSRPNVFPYSLIGLQHCCVYFPLFVVKLAGNREGDGLVGHVAVPLAPHVQQHHLVLLYYLIVLHVVQSSAVSSA